MAAAASARFRFSFFAVTRAGRDRTPSPQPSVRPSHRPAAAAEGRRLGDVVGPDDESRPVYNADEK